MNWLTCWPAPPWWLPGIASTNTVIGESDVSTTTKTTDTIPSQANQVLEFVQRAQSGDASTLPALRQMLQNPAVVEALGGDLARQAEMSLIAAAAGENLAFKEALIRKLELLRAELAGPNPTPVERLLVERIVACWLQVQDADIRYAQAKDLSIPWGDSYQQRMDRAHRRFLSAVKTLALVRRLALPVLLAQVNILGGSGVESGVPGQPVEAGRLGMTPAAELE
jgi:hypothetical protein